MLCRKVLRSRYLLHPVTAVRALQREVERYRPPRGTKAMERACCIELADALEGACRRVIKHSTARVTLVHAPAWANVARNISVSGTGR